MLFGRTLAVTDVGDKAEGASGYEDFEAWVAYRKAKKHPTERGRA